MAMWRKMLLLCLCALLAFGLAGCSFRVAYDEDDENSKNGSLEQGMEGCNHIFSQWRIERNRTCEKDGKKSRECHICGREEEMVWVATGHDFGSEKCNTCGKPATSCKHTKCDTVITDEPACETDGIQRTICQKCKAIVSTEYLPAPGHTWKEHEGKEPTCEEDGWYPYQGCVVCGYSTIVDREPTGHDFFAGVCRTCKMTDGETDFLVAKPIQKNVYIAEQSKGSHLTSPATGMDRLQAFLEVSGETDSYAMTVELAGVYRIWITGLPDGGTVKLYFKDYMGETLEKNTSCKNGDGISVFVSTPGVYTIEVCQYKGLGSYYLNVGHQTPSMDLSSYTSWSGAFDYVDQEHYFVYVPQNSGNHVFTLSGMESGAYASFKVLTPEGKVVSENAYLYNNNCVQAELTEGETYFLALFYRNQTTAVEMHIGRPKRTADITGYNVVKDSVDFHYQENRYTFVAEQTAYHLVCGGMKSDDTALTVVVYNSAGRRIASGNDCRNGDSFALTNLTVGEEYSVCVMYKDSATPYELGLYSQKPAVEVAGRVVIEDSLEFAGQRNWYLWTALSDGDMSVISLGIEGPINIFIYNEEGDLFADQSYCFAEDGPCLYGVCKGDTYRILVEFDMPMSYSIAIQ